METPPPAKVTTSILCAIIPGLLALGKSCERAFLRREWPYLVSKQSAAIAEKRLANGVQIEFATQQCNALTSAGVLSETTL